MPTLLRNLSVAIVALAMLSGCGTQKHPIVPEPLPSTTPIFATDEDALAAAEAAYAAYLKVVDQIFADGGAGADRLLAVATPELVAKQSEGFREASRLGQRGTGTTSFKRMTIQMLDANPSNGAQFIVVYVCEDISKVDIVDAEGKSVVTGSRENVIPTEVDFSLVNSVGPTIKVSGIEAWTGVDFCLSS